MQLSKSRISKRVAASQLFCMTRNLFGGRITDRIRKLHFKTSCKKCAAVSDVYVTAMLEHVECLRGSGLRIQNLTCDNHTGLFIYFDSLALR